MFIYFYIYNQVNLWRSVGRCMDGWSKVTKQIMIWLRKILFSHNLRIYDFFWNPRSNSLEGGGWIKNNPLNLYDNFFLRIYCQWKICVQGMLGITCTKCTPSPVLFPCLQMFIVQTLFCLFVLKLNIHKFTSLFKWKLQQTIHRNKLKYFLDVLLYAKIFITEIF